MRMPMNRKTAAVATLLLVCAGCDVPYVDTNIVSYDDSGFDREAFLMVVQGLETTQIDGVVMGSADSAFAGRVLITKKSDPQHPCRFDLHTERLDRAQGGDTDVAGSHCRR